MAPTGKVTLVFTDVQHSTILWESTPTSMSLALQLHNSLFRSTLLEYEGYEVKTEGDSFMIAFKKVLQAAKFCVAIQELLMKCDWPEELLQREDAKEVYDDKKNLVFKGLRVRMVRYCSIEEISYKT
jgi:adenylate cyclase